MVKILSSSLEKSMFVSMNEYLLIIVDIADRILCVE